MKINKIGSALKEGNKTILLANVVEVRLMKYEIRFYTSSDSYSFFVYEDKAHAALNYDLLMDRLQFD